MSLITVLGCKAVVNEYASKIAGQPPKVVETWELKCMLHMEDGTIDVGTTRIAKALAPEGVVPGQYEILYRAGRSFKDDKIIGVVSEFIPVRPGAVPPGTPMPQPASAAAKSEEKTK